MSCPSCHSEEWKAASLVYRERLSMIDSSTVGFCAASNHAVGIGSAATENIQQTDLSKLAAPPIRPQGIDTINAVLFALVTLAAGYLAIHFGASFVTCFAVFLWIFTMAGLVSGLVSDSAHSKEAYEQALAEYQKKRMCMRCGTFYDPR